MASQRCLLSVCSASRLLYQTGCHCFAEVFVATLRSVLSFVIVLVSIRFVHFFCSSILSCFFALAGKTGLASSCLHQMPRRKQTWCCPYSHPAVSCHGWVVGWVCWDPVRYCSKKLVSHANASILKPILVSYVCDVLHCYMLKIFSFVFPPPLCLSFILLLDLLFCPPLFLHHLVPPPPCPPPPPFPPPY